MAIVVVAVVAGIAFGLLWAFVAGGAVLVASELVERAARRKRRQATGAAGSPSPLRTVFAKRRRPGDKSAQRDSR